MNDLYFACPKCRRYTDAGYRWAYWTLEDPQLINRGEGIDVDKVLSCAQYWNPADDEKNDWLGQTLFPTVKRFLERHRSHGIVFIDSDFIYAEESLMYNWIEVDHTSPET